jgi:hypothetical protein
MTAPHAEAQKDPADGGVLDAVVVGGSQAGLAMAWHLAQRAGGSWSWRPALRSAMSGGLGGTR